eukprot:5305681-Amphidinium_carterae.1
MADKSDEELHQEIANAKKASLVYRLKARSLYRSNFFMRQETLKGHHINDIQVVWEKTLGVCLGECQALVHGAYWVLRTPLHPSHLAERHSKASRLSYRSAGSLPEWMHSMSPCLFAQMLAFLSISGITSVASEPTQEVTTDSALDA